MSKSVVEGSVISGKVEKDRLMECSFSKPVGFHRGKPFCLCSLGSGVCRSNGKRTIFLSF